METITFYSYKGGAGRTLALANIAQQLARLKQRVMAIDFDLEAPGLHYKWGLDQPNGHAPIVQGVVDYFHGFATTGALPPKLGPFVVDVPAGRAAGGTSIQIMPAGAAPSKAYWDKLSRIDWRRLLFEPGAQGVPLFLEFKERIRQEFEPDFLLIDARTGVTEIGGMASAILADKVVALVLNNRENLDGSRAVLRSLRRGPRLPGVKPVEIIVGLSRIPAAVGPEAENTMCDQVREFLNADADDLQDTLQIADVFLLHSEPDLQVNERLRIGGDKSPDESILLRDYLRLFLRLVSPGVISPHIGALVKQARELAFDEPDEAQRALESLAQSVQHPEAYRELIRFYRLRNAEGELVLKTGERLWDIARRNDDPLLWDIIKRHFDEVEPETPDARPPTGMLVFVESVWRAAGSNDIRVGRALAESYDNFGQGSHAADLLVELVGATSEEAAVTLCIRQLRRASRLKEAVGYIRRFADTMSPNPEFLAEWARCALATADPAMIAELLGKSATTDRLATTDPPLALRLYAAGGLTKDADSLAERIVARAAKEGSPDEITQVGRIYTEWGRWSEFESRLTRYNLSSRTLEGVKRRAGPSRYPRF